jgi:hypothetical protein
MADQKRTRSRKRRSRDYLRFPEVKGKIVERVEIDPEADAVVIVFQDHTVLSFDIAPHVLVYPELSDWKSGNWKGIKRWPPVQSRGSIVKWP